MSFRTFFKNARRAISLFSKKEHFIFWVLVSVLVISTLIMLQKINSSFMTEVPMKGGKIEEAIAGVPRFVNPVLANSQADLDLVALVYSGLMRKDSNGALIPDLAAGYETSEDGLVYTFTLKDKIYFHDGAPVTADDVVFTVNNVKDPVMKSPKKGNWDGVSAEKVDDKKIKFTLKQHYASFLDSTTLGIMPARLWENSPLELNEANIKPVGSGPYKVEKLGKQPSGLIDYYELSSFGEFALGKPYISKIILRFYLGEEETLQALEAGAVGQVSSISPEHALELGKRGYRIESVSLPRVFALFLNQNQNQIFLDKNIIRAIDLLADKDSILNNVILGYGKTIDSPIPPGIYGNAAVKDNTPREEKIKNAEELLKKSGWTKDAEGFLAKKIKEGKSEKTLHLEFSISTSNSPELSSAAELLKEELLKAGMKVDVKTFEIGNLNQSVIKPRKYDALLFGQIINHESDLFAFWHSSQRKDPGLNIAMYTNAKADKILEEAFITTDTEKRKAKYREFESEVKKDMPAIFLYAPNFTYVVSKDIKGFEMNRVVSPADRFLSSYLWYTETDKVWKVFSR